MPRLTEQEQQEIVRYIEADKPLPDKFRFLLFEDKREVEVKDRVNIQGDEMSLALAPGINMEFVRIPTGTFLMGTNAEPYTDKALTYRDEMPQHKVHLDEYWLGKYPVTNAQYKTFVDAIGYEEPSHFENREFPKGKADHPVGNVTWHDARFFCGWASEISDAEIRLPTEAQWEKAVRGTDGRKYPWGDQKPNVDLCNFEDNIGDSTRVGRYSPQGDSPYGCADMAGNVWEWVSSLWGTLEPVYSSHVDWTGDWLSSIRENSEKGIWEPEYGYPYRADDGRENLEAGDEVCRNIRGGSRFDLGKNVRAANRKRHTIHSNGNIGFRCACSAASP